MPINRRWKINEWSSAARAMIILVRSVRARRRSCDAVNRRRRGQLRHSHLPLRFCAGLERMLVSPAMHQLHHSVDPRHHDKNFGLAFAIWDRLLGTLMLPDKELIGELGLSNGEGQVYNSVWTLYVLPFVKLFRRRQPSIDKPLGSAS
jgi:hypothetical protein